MKMKPSEHSTIYDLDFVIRRKKNLARDTRYLLKGYSLKDIKKEIKRLIAIARKEKNLPTPKHPEQHESMYLDKYPATGYSYTLTKVTRRIAKEEQIKFKK